MFYEDDYIAIQRPCSSNRTSTLFDADIIVINNLCHVVRSFLKVEYGMYADLETVDCCSFYVTDARSVTHSLTCTKVNGDMQCSTEHSYTPRHVVDQTLQSQMKRKAKKLTDKTLLLTDIVQYSTDQSGFLALDAWYKLS